MEFPDTLRKYLDKIYPIEKDEDMRKTKKCPECPRRVKIQGFANHMKKHQREARS